MRPKLVFHKIRVKTSGEQWRNDRKQMITSNPVYYHTENAYIKKDKAMLLKRREGTLMKNVAMQNELEIANRKVDREIRKLVF